MSSTDFAHWAPVDLSTLSTEELASRARYAQAVADTYSAEVRHRRTTTALSDEDDTAGRTSGR